MVLNPAKAGSPLRTILYHEVSSLGYTQKQETGLFSKRTRHLVSLDAAGETIVLRVEKDAVEGILAALEERTGLSASRPSAK